MKAVHVAAVGMLILPAGCATPAEPRAVMQEVKAPAPVPCSIDSDPRPDLHRYTRGSAGARDIFEQVKLLQAGRHPRDARLAELPASTADYR